MLKVEDIERIRRAYYVEKKSIRAIAREQGHHRRVVREAVAGTNPPPRRYRRQKPRPRTMVGPVAHLSEAWLEADRDAPPKQRHTAKRIYDRLVAEHGYSGKDRAIRAYVHDWKAAHRSEGQGFVPLPLAYTPGAEAQCDWGEAVVRIGGREQEAHVFCMRLCYALKSFLCAFPAARQECFFAGHVAAFAFFGGVPRRIVYDNLTSAVAKVLQGRNRVEQDAFVAFRGHYLFASHFCLPGREGAHEKPLVESLVGYARRNFLVPVPYAASWEELNAQLSVRCVEEDGRPASGRGGTIGALWAEERRSLLPLQRHAYPCCRTVPVRATRQALVTFERNRYSVPTRYGGERLLLRCGRLPGRSRSPTDSAWWHGTPGSMGGTASTSSRCTTCICWSVPASAGAQARSLRPGPADPAVGTGLATRLRTVPDCAAAGAPGGGDARVRAHLATACPLRGGRAGHRLRAGTRLGLLVGRRGRATRPSGPRAREPASTGGRRRRSLYAIPGDGDPAAGPAPLRCAAAGGGIMTMAPGTAAQILLWEDALRRLRLPAVLHAYPKLAQEAATQGLPYEAFLLALVEQEVAQRDANMQRRRSAAARFPALKTLDQYEYDFSVMPQLNRALILELAQGGYIAKKAATSPNRQEGELPAGRGDWDRQDARCHEFGGGGLPAGVPRALHDGGGPDKRVAGGPGGPSPGARRG
jgi:transposase